ncbi:MAG: DUF447 family protein, partial [Pirellulaceae bacterium]|nr:DUF447 family protein [Pirellulaceae bacterium]
ILEGIVTTLQDDGSPHFSPMGPRVDRPVTRLMLRPYRTSQTYRNLKSRGAGVFHVIDDVELMARAAIGKLESVPPVAPARCVPGVVLADACRWFEFRVTELDDAAERTTIACEVIATGAGRDFFGFNRAKHAVLEAAILATRVGILPAEQIRAELARLVPLVEKTAGEQERRAFDLLQRHLADVLPPVH